MFCYSHGKAKKKQKRRLLYDLLFTWKSEKRLPECLGKGTRGRVVFQKREPLSAWNRALGEGLFKNNGKCSSLSAWDKALGEEDLKKTVDGTDGVKSFPSVRFLALGEDLFPVSRIPDRSSPSVALGEGFPECI
jgi:hypothetical protein